MHVSPSVIEPPIRFPSGFSRWLGCFIGSDIWGQCRAQILKQCGTLRYCPSFGPGRHIAQDGGFDMRLTNLVFR